MFIKSQEGWTTHVQKTLVKIKLLYIRLIHNLGRDNCTYKNLKRKKGKTKPKTLGTSRKIEKNKSRINLLNKKAVTWVSSSWGRPGSPQC